MIGRFVPIYVVVHTAQKPRRNPLSSLLRPRDRFELLARNLPIGVFEVDTDGRFLYVNDQWCKLVGRDRESLDTENWSSIVHPEDLDRVMADWHRSRAERRDFSLEYRY